jgi:purine-binding chemotaxis protein CheW
MSTPTTTNLTKLIPGAQAVSLLIFSLAEQLYGIPVADVIRIIEMVALTQIAHAPEAIRGIINVRGKLFPVMDLRYRLNLPLQAYSLHTPIILVNIENDKQMGLIVDSVMGVLEIEAGDMEAVATIVTSELAQQMQTQTAYLVSVAKVNRQLILVLDVQAILSPLEQADLTQLLEPGLTPHQVETR